MRISIVKFACFTLSSRFALPSYPLFCSMFRCSPNSCFSRPGGSLLFSLLLFCLFFSPCLCVCFPTGGNLLLFYLIRPILLFGPSTPMGWGVSVLPRARNQRRRGIQRVIALASDS
ncbi:hypothetical protein BO71DRAFT_205705 [Aspergillus ellipticus CBS 707.79]|uniref:Transmembrane protein n=1 Tax=Aspergillus ellipticus CBS 707.79 TaxID=1448320 RepID=A0A319E3X7_9EURO|nr:hypothetical protein BO71DRAFT_205705 [Aspergillus ellipticus CBS 707.79]